MYTITMSTGNEEKAQLVNESYDIMDDDRVKARVDFRKRSSTTSQSKDSDYTDSSGVCLLKFITNTLHKNQRDRDFLIEVEKTMIEFVSDKSKEVYKFSPMSSYNRMLIHRIAAFFGLDHNVDQNGSAIVINKSDHTRIPETKFEALILHSNFADRYQYRRNVQSFDEGRLADYMTICGSNIITENAINSMQMSNVRRAQSFDAKQWYGPEISDNVISPSILTNPTASAGKTECGQISPNAQQISSNVAPIYSWSPYYYQWTPPVETPCTILISGNEDGPKSYSTPILRTAPLVSTVPPIYFQTQTPNQYMIQQSIFASPALREIQQITSDDNISYLTSQMNNQLSLIGTPHQSSSMNPQDIPTVSFPSLRRALSSPARDYTRDKQRNKNRSIFDPKRKRQRSYGAVEKDLGDKYHGK